MVDLEDLSVSAVKRAIALCPRLKGRIDSNDKTPITDGEIDLYNSHDQRNDNLLGRVSVQVKGRTDTKKIKNDSTSWRIDRASLEFFRGNGGALYFYVPFDKEGTERGIFWVALTPFKADALLKNMKPPQKVLSVSFKRMPNDATALEKMVTHVWKRRYELTNINFDDVQSSTERLYVTSLTPLSTSSPTFLDPGNDDYTVEARTRSGTLIPISVALAVYPQTGPQRRDVTIGCGDTTFSTPIVERIDDTETRIGLSDGLTIRLQRTGNGLRASIDLTPTGTLYDQLDDVSFFLSMAEGNPLIVNGKAMDPLPIEKADWSELIDARDQLRKMVTVLSTLGIPTALARTLDTTAREKQLLLTLNSALVEGKEVGVSAATTPRMHLPLGPYQILVLALDGADDGHRRIIDPFSVGHLRDLYIWQPPDDSDPPIGPQRVTLYDALTVEDLGRTLNLHVANIADAYQNLPDRRQALERATWTALNLLHAFDAATSPLMARYLLQGASNLTTWLVQQGGGDSIYSINDWQTKYRLKVLTDEDKQQIRRARRQQRTQLEQNTGPDDAALREACFAILLNEPDELDLILEDLTPEQDDQLRSYPIWTLARNMGHGAATRDTPPPGA